MEKELIYASESRTSEINLTQGMKCASRWNTIAFCSPQVLKSRSGYITDSFARMNLAMPSNIHVHCMTCCGSHASQYSYLTGSQYFASSGGKT